jgi:flagellar biosynthesis/type III secretory pathway M-ring protein FliF/YscJ
MRKLLTWIVVTVGIAALVRKFRKRSEADTTRAEPAADEPADEDPAEELRQKLADTREDVPETGASTPEPSVDERRTEVHDQGRAAIDEMQRSSED